MNNKLFILPNGVIINPNNVSFVLIQELLLRFYFYKDIIYSITMPTNNEAHELLDQYVQHCDDQLVSIPSTAPDK